MKLEKNVQTRKSLCKGLCLINGGATAGSCRPCLEALYHSPRQHGGHHRNIGLTSWRPIFSGGLLCANDGPHAAHCVSLGALMDLITAVAYLVEGSIARGWH